MMRNFIIYAGLLVLLGQSGCLEGDDIKTDITKKNCEDENGL